MRTLFLIATLLSTFLVTACDELDCPADSIRAGKVCRKCEPGRAPKGGLCKPVEDAGEAIDSAADEQDANANSNLDATPPDAATDEPDGPIDEGCEAPITFFRDDDRDGYGAIGSELESCDAPEGYVDIPGDCDDASPDVHPGATELCNGKDDDCNATSADGLGDCNGLLCNDAACLTSCTSSAGCIAGLECGGTECTGKLALGAQCGGDAQCVSASCGPSSTCQMPGGTGASCNSPGDCRQGTTCAGAKCKAANGEACGADGECLSDSCVGTCGAPVGFGGTCNTPADCQAGLACDGTTCKRVNNAACGGDTECLSGSCAPSGVCQNRGNYGASCDSAPDCAAQLMCAANVCKRVYGVSCTLDAECVSNMCAGGPPSVYPRVCRAGYVGDVCDAHNDCSVHCSLCTSKRICLIGSGCECIQSSDCESGMCNPEGSIFECG